MKQRPTSVEDIKTTTNLVEFLREATADFNKVCKDLCATVKREKGSDMVVSFYGHKYDVASTDVNKEPIVLHGVLNHVGFRDPDFGDNETDMAMAFNMYKDVDDYGHEEGNCLWFLRSGRCASSSFSGEEAEGENGLRFHCMLTVSYNHELDEAACAKIMGRSDDEQYGCSAMSYRISIGFEEGSVENKRQNKMV